MTEKILYQHGTLGALMAGLMDGTETIAHILEKGTLGLGTLHGLDGEVIFFRWRSLSRKIRWLSCPIRWK